MMDIEEIIKKWDEQIALHRRVCDDPLMYTKEERLKNSHYAQAICAVIADLKKITTPVVVGRSEQLFCPDCKSKARMQNGFIWCENDDCGGIYRAK